MFIPDKPLAVILDTLKGKGIKEAENTMATHSMSVSREVYEIWLKVVKSL